MKVTFLGTGTSQGVPIITCTCVVCSSTDPRDNRLRSSVLIETERTNIVIDTGPDFRQQMLRENVHMCTFSLSICCLKSGPVSITILVRSVSISTLLRSLLSLGSVEEHTTHVHVIIGTPCEVPVPRNVTFISYKDAWNK